MWTIVTDGVAGSASLGQSVSPTKMAELIEMLFRMWTRVSLKKHVLDGVHIGRWRHLANTIEPSVCSGDAAFCQINLTTCYCCAEQRKACGRETENKKIM